MKNALSNGPEQVVTLRRLKWLGVALVISNLFLGALSMYLLRSQDRDYSQLIDQSVPLLNQMRDMGREGSVAFRSLIEALISKNESDTQQALGRMRAALAREDSLRDLIARSPMVMQDPARAAALTRNGAAFDSALLAIAGRTTAANSADAEEPALRKLSAVGVQYGQSVEQVADYVESQTHALSDRYTAAARSRSAFMLGIAGWPLLLAGVVIALTVAVVIVMLFVFRQADAGDGP